MKYAPHSNHKNPEIPGVAALRDEAVDMSGARKVAAQMLRTMPGVRHRPSRLLYTFAAAAAVLGGVMLLPRTARPVSLHDVGQAIKEYHSWYEQTYRPDSSGRLQLANEFWEAPGKSTWIEWRDGKLASEMRFNGKLHYQYLPAEKSQRITSWGMDGMPLSTVESFEQFKLLDVRPEGKLLRYRFAIHQDLLIDPATKLPVERDVYHRDGSILEIHKIFLTNHIDDQIFEAAVKPGVPLFDIPAAQAAVRARLSGTPQTQVVGGVAVSLHAVIIENGPHAMRCGAVLVGGVERPTGAPEHILIVGVTAPESRPQFKNVFDIDPNPGEKTPLIVGGKVAHLERAGWPVMPPIPDRFTLRVPVWGSGSKFAGWAEFEVVDPIRTESIEEVLPNFVEPGLMTATDTAKPETQP